MDSMTARVLECSRALDESFLLPMDCRHVTKHHLTGVHGSWCKVVLIS